ncbi:MAG: hypothetical protein F6K53_43955 [Moorea sp. SIO4A1]|uniref:hypothetical protein n=1 Tax=Moorena sp. SIO4A1 TaxID=2607835 RepID=UPI00144B378A|nr:hypothetical protein [Moorena sp. SIO4A1]NEQ63878.1 hypothetical protein [Moorena sp. SIO4A1]
MLINFSIGINKNFKLEDQDKLKNVRINLYEELYLILKKSKIKDTYLNKLLKVRIVNYIDKKYENKDRDRLYIEILLNTIRNTKITTLCRCLIQGNNLYIAADSYALGRLNKTQLILNLIILLLIILIPSLFNIFVISIILAILYLLLFWIKFFRALSQKESFLSALRINFHKNLSSNDFDLDDSFMHLKTIMPLIISAIQEVLEKNKMLEPDLKQYLDQTLKNISSQTININTQGGSIIGAILGGKNNAINN